MDHRFPDNLLLDSSFIRLGDNTFIPMVKIGNMNIHMIKGGLASTFRSIHWFGDSDKLSYSKEEILNWIEAQYESAVIKWHKDEHISWRKSQWYMPFYIYRYLNKGDWFDYYRLFFEEAMEKAVEITSFSMEPFPFLFHGLRVCYLDNDEYDGQEYDQTYDKLKNAKMFVSVDTEKDLRFVWEYAKKELKLKYTWVIPGWNGKTTFHFPESVLSEFPNLQERKKYF